MFPELQYVTQWKTATTGQLLRQFLENRFFKEVNIVKFREECNWVFRLYLPFKNRFKMSQICIKLHELYFTADEKT